MAVSLLASQSTVNKKARDGSHGLKFESKLLALFCIRGLGAGYKFELGKENEDLAGKFDDVIFRYEVPDKTPAGKHWRYQYLQAKHKENENNRKITANDLLDPKGNGPFSLKKYFLSYCKMRVRGDDVRDCIVCTNWGVNEEKFKIIKLEDVKEQHDILKFSPGEKTTRSYKLQIDQVLRKETIKLLEVSDIEALGVTDPLFNDKLMVWFWDKNATNSNEDDNKLTLDLVTEKVVDSKSNKFHPNFLNDENLSVSAQKFRQKICEVIDDFYKKLIFVVNMPNEIQFKQIIETEDVKKYYQSDSCKVQTSRIFDEISDAFEKKSANFWLTSEEGKKILLAGVADVSLEYQRQLEKMVGFNEDAIKIMEKKLRQLMDSPGNKKVQRIATPSPQHTAVKVISAVQILLQEENQEGNYLVTSSSYLQDDEEMKRWKNILKLQKDFYFFVVVVCDNEESPHKIDENVIADIQAHDNNFEIIISRDRALDGITDEIKFEDLSKDFQKNILSKTVSFQGADLTVENLVGDKPGEVIDFNSIKELLFENKEVKIPSLSTSSFEQSLYIKRRLRFIFHDKFEDELAKSLGCTVNQLRGECRITTDGQIEWLVQDERQKDMWEKILLVANQPSTTGVIHEGNHWITFKDKGQQSVVIIAGVAGSGKSTILSHYYDEIKKAKPDHWVIRINLVDHYQAILKLSNVTRSNAVNFLIYQLQVADDQSSFSRSLLRSRFEKGDRIVLMFDGFDEIDGLCQDKSIQLMKAITEDKSTQLYVTTRTHMLNKLQFQLSQLAYSLENFSEKDQINCLASYWKKELNISGDNDEPLQQFAKSLVERVSKTLNDQEKSFVGIPLQCRILAECFQSSVEKLMEIPNYGEEPHQRRSEEFVNKISCLLVGQKFDLISLYNRLMETKRKIFLQDKANVTQPNQIVFDAIDRLIKDVEDHQTKLAIETIVVTDQKIPKVLWPHWLSHRSDEDLADEENQIALNSLKFGLTFRSGDNTKIQFLHRTYAEYLFARYLYKGFHLEDKRHNKLLENESVQKFILNKILATDQYEGVQVFFNNMLKELVDDGEEWRNRISRRDLPERFKTFANNFLTQFLRQYPSFRYPFQWVTEKRMRPFANALHYSLWNEKEKIFKFLCDLLDATFDKKLIRVFMMKFFMGDRINFTFKFFRNTEIELFQRFLDYVCFDDSECPTLRWYPDVLPPCGLEYSQWNGKDQQNMVSHLLKFLVKNRKAFDKYFFDYYAVEKMLTFFIINENYDNHLKIFLRFLSRSTAFSDDFNFAKLLIKVFCSKTHFVSGRIEKALTILQEDGRHNLLTQLNGIVLMREPEAFQTIYNPQEEEGVMASDIHLLLERDSYRMTRLHRAAFHGNSEAVEEILEKILEDKNVTDKVVNEVMAQDEFGFTPFYVAAARGQEEIYHKMLAFLKQNNSSDILGKYLIDKKGFVHRALSDAMELENIEMFQLILKAVKKELGQNELLRLLNPELHFHPRERNSFPYNVSFYIKCETKELFNAMAKIVVMGDDNVRDYTDLHHLVFHGDVKTSEIAKTTTKTALQYIDAEHLQGLLLLRGVDDFIKRVLEDTFGSLPFEFRLISLYLLKHFEQDQLKEFVQTITCKNNTTKVRSYKVGFDSARVFDPETELSALSSLNSVDSGWTKEHLVFEDQGNGITTIHGERLVPICYWRKFLNELLFENDSCSDLTYIQFIENSNHGLLNRQNVDCFSECFKWVGENSAKELLLHQDSQSFIMIRFVQKTVKFMLNCLSQESQEEVKLQWKNYAPNLDRIFPLNSQTFSVQIYPRRCSDILRFYLDYGTKYQLKEFVNVATVIHNFSGIRNSVWSYAFEKLDKEETKEILTLVIEKGEILGQDAVKNLLLHEIDQVPFIIKAVSWGEDVDSWLEILPKEMKREIQLILEQRAPVFIEKAFKDPKAFFKSFNWQHGNKRLNTFTFFINYSNEHQLQSFVQNITSIHVNSDKKHETRSLWAEIYTHDWEVNKENERIKTDEIAQMDKFMKIVSEKLGPNAVKELVLHQDGELLVIFYLELRGEEEMMETLLNYLSAKDRKKVQRRIDKFLDETYKIPRDGDWTEKEMQNNL